MGGETAALRTEREVAAAELFVRGAMKESDSEMEREMEKDPAE